MVFTVTMNSRQQQIRKHGNSGSSVANGYPATKRPRVGSSPAHNNKQSHPNAGTSKGHRLGSGYDSGVSTTSSQNINDDIFGDDDIFTGDALAELEVVASQAENCFRRESGDSRTVANTSRYTANNFQSSSSFKHPSNVPKSSSSKANVSVANETNFELNKLKEQCHRYESKLQQVEQENMQSRGEASLLRDKLRKAEQALLDERQLKSAEANKLKDEKSKKETELSKQVEVFKDQMEFKQAELKEAQDLIKNLEAKNKKLAESTHLTSVKKEGIFSPQRLSQSDEFMHKKIKFVKPESPRVSSSKHKLMKVEAGAKVPSAKSPSSSQETKPIVSNTQRKACRLLNPSKFPSTSVASVHQQELTDSLHKLLLECKRARWLFARSFREKQQIADCIEAVENLITHLSEESCKRDISHILPMIDKILKRHLSCTSDFNNNVPETGGIETVDMDVALSVLTSVMNCYPSISRDIGNQLNDLVSMTNAYLSTNQAKGSSNHTVKLFKFLSFLSKPALIAASNNALDRFLKTSDVLTCYVTQSTLRHEVLNIAMNLTDYPSVIERLATPVEGQGESFVLKVCTLGAEEASYESGSLSFLAKVVAFLSELTCKHEAVLSKQGCFAEVYHALNLILYHQLRLWEKDNARSVPRDRLLSQFVCLLHSCSNIYAEGIPGVARDHRHPVVLWKLQRFLEKQTEQSLWLTELRKIVEAEVKSMEAHIT